MAALLVCNPQADLWADLLIFLLRRDNNSPLSCCLGTCVTLAIPSEPPVTCVHSDWLTQFGQDKPAI